ncbi:hypothetical protein DVH24_014492 [Malus domestica]|uniref:Cytochrome f n=1 Tax=Malus domestica TaxID=3750 RepID=A0A498KKE1_MALDO|nr:hypothetical protein DVH24_014492 [Malus domestica]
MHFTAPQEIPSNPTILQLGSFDRLSDGCQVVDIIPQGLKLLVSEGESVKLDQPLTSNPNVGGFGQGDLEIVLQDPFLFQWLGHFDSVVAVEALKPSFCNIYPQIDCLTDSDPDMANPLLDVACSSMNEKYSRITTENELSSVSIIQGDTWVVTFTRVDHEISEEAELEMEEEELLLMLSVSAILVWTLRNSYRDTSSGFSSLNISNKSIDSALMIFKAQKGIKGRKNINWKVVKFKEKATYTQQKIDTLRIEWAEHVDDFIPINIQ